MRPVRQARLEQKSWVQVLELSDTRTFSPLESGWLERALLPLLI